MYKSYDELGAQPVQNRDKFNVVEIQDQEHKQQIISQNRVVCVDVYAHWCQPCMQTESSYAIIESTYSKDGVCAVVKENFEHKLTPGITGLPTYIFYLDGKIVDHTVGADLEEVEKKLRFCLDKLETMSSKTEGPSFNRNTIRNSKSIPQMEQDYNTNSKPRNPSKYKIG